MVDEQAAVGKVGERIVKCLVVQALFERFLSCDVVDGADYVQRFSTFPTYYLAAAVDPQHLAVSAHYAVLKIKVRILIGSIVENLSEQMPIFRMKHLRNSVECG